VNAIGVNMPNVMRFITKSRWTGPQTLQVDRKFSPDGDCCGQRFAHWPATSLQHVFLLLCIVRVFITIAKFTVKLEAIKEDEKK